MGTAGWRVKNQGRKEIGTEGLGLYFYGWVGNEIKLEERSSGFGVGQ